MDFEWDADDEAHIVKRLEMMNNAIGMIGVNLHTSALDRSVAEDEFLNWVNSQRGAIMRTTRRKILAVVGGAFAGLVLPSVGSQRPGAPAFAQALPGASTFRGATGKSIVGPVTLSAGISVIRAQHNGTANFIVDIFLPKSGETPQQSHDADDYSDGSTPYNVIGAFNRSASVWVAGTPGDHYLAVDSSGAFQISVEQPLPETVNASQLGSVSGRGMDVSPYFTLPAGIGTVSAQSTSPNLVVWIYHLDDLGGEILEGGIDYRDGRYFDFSFPDHQTSYPIQLPDSGPYLVAARTSAAMTDSWSVQFS